MLIRFFDILFSVLGLTLGLPLLILLWVIGLFDTGSPIFFQQRLGQNRKPFLLVKFRTMKPDTASVPTHLADVSAITPLGYFLRRTKIDELPQLWNVLVGDMSLVGPRPCLKSQEDLIAEREGRQVFKVRPGITGLAQVQAIDMSTPKLLAKTDALMLKNMSVKVYFFYIYKTITGAGRGDRIKLH